jgi:SAM-dependent methyltransferase
MPQSYFATHAAGFGPLVARLAARDAPGFALLRAEDNALLFSAEAEPRAVLSYCRGLFRLLGEAQSGLERAARGFARDPAVVARIANGPPARRGPRGDRSFVLRAFGPDDPASLPFEPRRELEAAIARATALRPDSSRPDREYRVQERADGTALFLERVDSALDSPRPGELPRTTCRLLAELSEPRPDDVFLDPFCGYGGIALERALAAPYRFVFASDLEAAKVAAVKESLSAKGFERRRKTFFPKARDALDATAFEAGFVTAIATDPPWGLYEGGVRGEEAEELLRRFMAEASRLLAPGGRLVLLVRRDARLEPGSEFAQRERMDVLVSGKKARALRLDRV